MAVSIADTRAASQARLARVPDPPARGSLAERAELATLHVLQDHRTPQGNAWAQRMDQHGAVGIWRDDLREWRQHSGLVQGLVGSALLATTLTANLLVTAWVKHDHHRARPFQVDPTIVPIVPRPFGASYPSGHTSSAFAAATIMAALDPARAGHYLAQAGEVGASRLYAGVHFPTDVAIGAALGAKVANTVLRLVPGV
jgi:undecaprenyl-diphosphatase